MALLLCISHRDVGTEAHILHSEMAKHHVSIEDIQNKRSTVCLAQVSGATYWSTTLVRKYFLNLCAICYMAFGGHFFSKAECVAVS